MIDIKEIRIINKVKEYLNEIPNVIDIGGFKGDWTVETLKYIPNSKVFIFEPNSDNFSHLEKRFLNNDNIKLINYGVSDKCCSQKYFNLKSDDNSVRGMSGFVKREIYNRYNFEELEINVVNLDSLELFNDKIDFLKIDVEGYEYNVLSGMKNILSNLGVKFIQFEYGGTYKDANFELNDVISLLSGFGYKVYDIQDDDSLIEIDEFIDDYQYNNFISTYLKIN